MGKSGSFTKYLASSSYLFGLITLGGGAESLFRFYAETGFVSFQLILGAIGISVFTGIGFFYIMRREILSDDPYSLEAEEFDIVLPFWGAFFIGPGYYLARMAQPMDTRKIRFMKQVDYLLLTQGVITLGLHAFLVIDVMRWCNLTENLANDDCDTADASSFLYSMLLKFGIQFLSSLILVISVVLDFVGSWCGRDKASKVAKRLSKQQREEQKGRMIDHQPASTQIRIR